MRPAGYILSGLLLPLAIAATVAWSPARAAEPKPEVVDEADLLRVQNAQLRVELAARTLEDAKREAEKLTAEVRGKYKLGDADAVDPQTRVIRRKPKAGK